MGKIRVKTVGDEQAEKKQEEKSKKKKEAKEQKVSSDVIATLSKTEGEAISTDGITASSRSVDMNVSPRNDEKKEKKVKKDKKAAESKRSARYKEVKTLVDRTKKYSLKDSLELLPQIHLATFDETVELHINTHEAGISGNVTLPHGTGKKTRVVIVDDKVIADVEKGIINFDVLVATPAMMPKLAKVAKILGPRGLMPNPKSGTVTQNPEEVVKKYEGGQMRFKTESKSPIIHLTIGKLSFGNKKLSENIETAFKAVQTSNIKSAVLKSTMSPGIKIEVDA